MPWFYRGFRDFCKMSAVIFAIFVPWFSVPTGARRFHAASPLTAKLRCPVAVGAQIVHAGDLAGWAWQYTGIRRGRWDRLEARATPRTHFQTIKTVLKTTRWLTGSQCRSSRTGMMVRQLVSWVHLVHVIEYGLVTERLPVQLSPGPVQATLSKLLKYCVLRPTQPPTLSGNFCGVRRKVLTGFCPEGGLEYTTLKCSSKIYDRRRPSLSY